MTIPSTEASPQAGLADLANETARIATRMNRGDLATRVIGARDRAVRHETVIAIVGEFKRGKSSLVNGLLGESLCPVDDDVATAVLTLIRHGSDAAFAWRTVEGERRREPVAREDLNALIRERAEDPRKAGLEFIEVHLENALLGRGLALVDTPGVGGLTPGYSATTLGYLHAVDALFFVMDSSAPLTAAELTFLQRAVAICPPTIGVLTKTDLYPEWRKIQATNNETLTATGLDVPIVPVSSVLRSEAFARRDGALNEESGYPELLGLVSNRVLDPARSGAAARSSADLIGALEHLGATLITEKASLEDPSTTSEQMANLAAQKERLDRLRGANSRWFTILNDEFTDLVSEADHQFRQSVRQASRKADDSVDAADPLDTFEALASELRETMAEASLKAIRDLESGADAIAERIAAILAEEDVRLGQLLGLSAALSVEELWTADAPAPRLVVENAATAWASLRGAQGGILVFGMLANLAGMVLTTGAMVGIGVLFGGKQILDERKRQVTARRQKARTAIRQYLDDVQFEVGKSTRDLGRVLQRQLRDHFSTRISESIASCASSADTLQRGLQSSEAQRGARLAEVGRELEVIADLHRRASAIRAGLVA